MYAIKDSINPPFHLSSAVVGDCLVITALLAGRCFDRRMTSMGLNVHSRLKIVQRRRCGAMVIARDGTRLALGAGMACKVMVRKVECDR